MKWRKYPAVANLSTLGPLSPLERLIKMKPAIIEDDNNDDISDGIPVEDDKELYTETGEVDPRYRLGYHLLRLGKVYYKHIEKLPEWVEERKDDICARRSPAQIRRCLKTWMINTDREVQSRYRLRNLGWRKKIGSDKKSGDIHAYGPEETIAYAQYHMPSRFAITKRVFDEIKTLLPDFRPRRILDFGCGPGTAAAAAVTVWGNDAISKYSGIDMSKAMIDAAKIMTNKLPFDCTYWEKTADVVKRSEFTGMRYDMAVATHTLTELTSDPAKQAATQLLFEMLDIGGLLVIIDNGNPVGSHTTRTARKFILETFNYTPEADEEKKKRLQKWRIASKEKVAIGKLGKLNSESPAVDKGEFGKEDVINLVLPAPEPYTHHDVRATVISPCTHDKPCPLGVGVWCSFSQKVRNLLVKVLRDS